MSGESLLKVFDLNPDTLLRTVQQMLCRGGKQLLLQSSKNDSIQPCIVQLADSVKFLSLSARLDPTTATENLSHCWAVVGGRKRQAAWHLSEASTGQHPRMVVEGSDGNKLQIYHLTFLSALTIPRDADSALAREFSESLAKEQLALLKQVTRKNTKSQGSPQTTVAHLCGNEFCVRPSHLRVVSKTVNEEHIHCHWIQKTHVGDADMVNIGRFVCPHEPKCVYLSYHFD